MTETKTALWIAAAIALAGATVWIAWPRSEPPAPAPPPVAPAAPPGPPPAVPASANLPPPPAPVAPGPQDVIVYPDGSRMLALNGVTRPPKPTYPEGLKFTPVVRTVRLPDGRDWYQHEDGTLTTTYWTWRADLGRYDAVADLMAKAAQKPVVDDEVTPPKQK